MPQSSGIPACRQARTRSQPGCVPGGLSPHGWGNGPCDTYGWHEHGYEKVLYCVRGQMAFHIASGDIDLGPGDKLVLPPHAPHAATAGAEGVHCIEAPRPD